MYNKRRNKKTKYFFPISCERSSSLFVRAGFRTGTQQLNTSVTTVSARVRTLLDKVVYAFVFDALQNIIIHVGD